MSRWIVIAVLLLVPVFAQAQINALPPQPHLLVKGHAEGRYVPDRFTVNLLVAVTDKLPDTARERVETHMQQLFAALDKSGALRKQTEAGTLQIEPRSEYVEGKTVFLGTQVRRTVAASFDDLAKLRAFLGQLDASEEVQVQSTEASRSDIDQIRQDLRKRAIANSQETAKQMAAAYGMNLKGVYSVSEVAPQFAYGIRAGSWGAGTAYAAQELSTVTVTGSRIADPDLRVGTLEVEQDMYAVYLTGN